MVSNQPYISHAVEATEGVEMIDLRPGSNERTLVILFALLAMFVADAGFAWALNV